LHVQSLFLSQWSLSFGKINDPEALPVQDATDNGSYPNSLIILITTADNESTVNNVCLSNSARGLTYLYLGRFGHEILVAEQ
jgi:hypothetical protein